MQKCFLHFGNAGIFLAFQVCFCSCQKRNCSYILKKCRNVSYILEMQEYFLHFSNVFLQLSKAELFLHFKMQKCFLHFGNAWKCRNISYIFPMCFCSCQKLNCSCILKMQQCLLHFGCRNISSISSVFLQLSKAELFLHFKNAEMFPTFWKWRNISSNFSNVFLQLKLCR